LVFVEQGEYATFGVKHMASHVKTLCPPARRRCACEGRDISGRVDQVFLSIWHWLGGPKGGSDFMCRIKAQYALGRLKNIAHELARQA